jgi:DNA-binding MarR family transcriptional regulator
MVKRVARRPARSGKRGESTAVALGLDDLVGYNLRRAYGVQMQRFTSVFGPLSIRPVQMSILGLIYENPGLRQSELGKMLDIKRANMVPLLDELGHRGLVRRRPADTDRRSHVLELTPAGKKLTIKLLELHARLEENLAQVFGASERGQLLRLLKKFRQLDPEPDFTRDD